MNVQFTEQQLIEIAEYPRQAIEHADNEMKKKFLAHDPPSFPFKYFISVCKGWVEREKNKPQKRDGGKFSKKDKAPSKETIANRQRYHDEQMTIFIDKRTQQRNDRLVELGYNPDRMSHSEKVDIINRDKMSYYTGEDVSNKKMSPEIEKEVVKLLVEESIEDWALNYEKLIHARTLEDPLFAKICASFDRNPTWDRIDPVQKVNIWNIAHTPECKCRKNENAGLIMPDVAAKLNLDIATV